MGSLYAKDVIKRALDEVGYQGGKGTSKYTRELDAVDYWQMPPKDGAPTADWCSIFVNWCIYKSTQPEPDKWDAHYFTFEPDSGENLAAGCGYAADYYQSHDAWSSDCQGAERGDQVFFRNYAHTGLVIDWDESGIYTVEGNTTADGVPYCVAKKFYKYGDPDIDGFGHPRYDGYEPETEQGKENTQPQPTPEPDTALYYVLFEEVSPADIFAGLRLRSCPDESAETLAIIPNGEQLKVDRKTADGWAHTSYGQVVGWVKLAYLLAT